MTNNDDFRIMAMSKGQARRERQRKENDFYRKKTEENGNSDDVTIKGNDGDHTREKVDNAITETK